MGFANDEHVQGRGFMAPVEHVGFGSTEQPAMPFVIDGTRPAVGSVPVLDSWRSPSTISPLQTLSPCPETALSSRTNVRDLKFLPEPV